MEYRHDGALLRYQVLTECILAMCRTRDKPISIWIHEFIIEPYILSIAGSAFEAGC